MGAQLGRGCFRVVQNGQVVAWAWRAPDAGSSRREFWILRKGTAGAGFDYRMPQWDHPPVDMTFEPVEGQTVGPLDFPDLNALVSWVLSDGLAEGEGLPFAHLGDKLAHTISVRP